MLYIFIFNVSLIRIVSQMNIFFMIVTSLFVHCSNAILTFWKIKIRTKNTGNINTHGHWKVGSKKKKKRYHFHPAHSRF